MAISTERNISVKECWDRESGELFLFLVTKDLDFPIRNQIPECEVVVFYSSGHFGWCSEDKFKEKYTTDERSTIGFIRTKKAELETAIEKTTAELAKINKKIKELS